MDVPPATPPPWPHRKLYKHGASLKAEKRRDKVLTKLCDKACANQASTEPPAPTVIAPLTPTVVPRPVTLDKLSLQDCPVAISTDNLWGSTSPPQPASSNPPVPQAPSVPAPAPVPPATVPCQLLPDQLQQLIEGAVQKSLAAGLRPPSCHGSVRSASSISPEWRAVE